MNEKYNLPIKVLLTDDHQMFIDGVKSLLRKESYLSFVAECNSGEAAFDFITTHDVDLVITDINMPGMQGTELAKKIKNFNPEIKVLVLTMFNDPEIINSIIETEADGYILKNTGKQELIDAIKKILDDGTYYSDQVVNTMMQHVEISRQINEHVAELTERELEILKLVCEELTSAGIAERLYISKRTVETHRKHIMHKTGAKTIVGLIKFALENKIISQA